MKPNVDLTANRDFSRRGGGQFDALDRLIFKMTAIPWKKDHKDNLLLDKQDYSEVFLTGDKQRRKEKRRYHMYEREYGKVCDRCRRLMYPWNDNTLCYVCDKDIEKSNEYNNRFFRESRIFARINFGWYALDQIKTYD